MQIWRSSSSPFRIVSRLVLIVVLSRSYMYRLVLEYTRLLTIGEDAEVDYVDPASMI